MAFPFPNNDATMVGLERWPTDTTTAPANMNWQEVKSCVNKALKTAGGKIRKAVAPGFLENKARHWHALLHGASCECDEKVWMVDMEKELKQARMARVVGNMQVAAFDFLEHE